MVVYVSNAGSWGLSQHSNNNQSCETVTVGFVFWLSLPLHLTPTRPEFFLGSPRLVQMDHQGSGSLLIPAKTLCACEYTGWVDWKIHLDLVEEGEPRLASLPLNARGW